MPVKNMKVSIRLGLGFGSVVLLLLILSLLSVQRLAAVNDGTKLIAEDRVPKLMLANEVIKLTLDNGRHLRSMLLSTKEEDIEKFQKLTEANRPKIAEALTKMEKLLSTEKGRQLFKDISAKDAILNSKYDEFYSLAKSDNKKAIEYMINEFAPANNNFWVALETMEDFMRDLMEKAAADSVRTYNETRNLIITLSAVALLVAMVIAFWITHGLLKLLGGEPAHVVEIANKVASGDLTVEVAASTKDAGSILFAMKEMRDSLVRIASEVRNGTDTIASASQQIASGNADLSSRTEEQASSLEETASSMEELTSTVKQNADNARQANSLAQTASEVAVKGGAVVSEVVDTMASINESSKKIVDIIGVIDGIAFQTNILALNAAVEAARAGEQGRGFAVVASEVRNLAQRSATAAKEIKALIDNSVEKVDAGSKLVDQAGATMQEVVESIRRVTDIMAEISAASQEQTAGIEQINQAITQMDQVTQQNAALVEESAAASEAMQEQAGKLAQTVGVFKIADMHGAVTRTNMAAMAKKAAPITASAAPLATKRLALVGSTSSRDWEEF